MKVTSMKWSLGLVLLLGVLVTGCAPQEDAKDSFLDGKSIDKPVLNPDKEMKDRGLSDQDIAQAKANDAHGGGSPGSMR